LGFVAIVHKPVKTVYLSEIYNQKLSIAFANLRV